MYIENLEGNLTIARMAAAHVDLQARLGPLAEHPRHLTRCRYGGTAATIKQIRSACCDPIQRQFHMLPWSLVATVLRADRVR